MLRFLEMRHSHLAELLDRRHESQPFLAGRAAIRLLQGDAANAPGVADRRRRQRGFPTTEEQILGGKAVVVEGTAGELLEQAIGRVGQNRFSDQRFKLAVVEVIRLPLGVAINLDGRGIETFFLDTPADRRIGPERQGYPFTLVVSSRQQGPGESRGQEGRNRLDWPTSPLSGQAFGGQALAAAAIEADWRCLRNSEQAAALRHGNHFLRQRPHDFGAVHARHQQIRMFENLALLIGDHRQYGSALCHLPLPCTGPPVPTM